MSTAHVSLFTFISRQAVLAAAPMILAGTGELLAETAGVINIGIEGVMLLGCISAYLAAATTGSGALGLLAAIAAGLIAGSLFALVTVIGRADQIVAGAAMNLLAVGVSGSAWMLFQNARANANLPTSLPLGAGFAAFSPAWADHIPYFGPVLLHQYGLFYAAVLLAILAAIALRYTRAGVILRALGDSPEACEAAGVGVKRWRFGVLLLAGACAGAAGAYLSIMRTHTFASDMTGGQGFVVLALVIFGRWRVWGLVAGCLLFGAVNSLQQSLQTLRYTQHSAIMHALATLPFELFQMLPYVVALIALAILSRSAPGPRFLGIPWQK